MSTLYDDDLLKIVHTCVHRILDEDRSNPWASEQEGLSGRLKNFAPMKRLEQRLDARRTDLAERKSVAFKAWQTAHVHLIMAPLEYQTALGKIASASGIEKGAALSAVCRTAVYAFSEEASEAKKLRVSRASRERGAKELSEAVSVPLRTFEDAKLRQQNFLRDDTRSTLEKYGIPAGAVLGGAGFLALIGPIAGAIGAAGGLSGAAAFSSGLATLGGGSIASGGLGMLGGTWILAGAGAASGGLLGIFGGRLTRAQYREVMLDELGSSASVYEHCLKGVERKKALLHTRNRIDAVAADLDQIAIDGDHESQRKRLVVERTLLNAFQARLWAIT